VVPAAQPAPTYTPEQVAALIEKSNATKPPVQATPPRQLTQDEIDTKLNTFKISDAHVAAIHEGGPKAVQALQEIVSGAVKNAVTVATILMEDGRAKMMGELNPHIEFARQQQQLAAVHEYFEANPTHRGLDPLIGQVAEQLAKSGWGKGKSNKEVMGEVAKRVNDLATQLKVPLAASPAAATTTVAPATETAPTRMSTVMTGGQGNAGGSGKAAPSSEDAIWS
jgi:hypothetical protein